MSGLSLRVPDYNFTQLPVPILKAPVVVESLEEHLQAVDRWDFQRNWTGISTSRSLSLRGVEVVLKTLLKKGILPKARGQVFRAT